MSQSPARSPWLFLIVGLTVVPAALLSAADQPQWGAAGSRNMVSAEQGLPHDFDAGQRNHDTGQIEPATTKNVKWVTRLGDITYGTPIVAGGRIYVGTNNGAGRDPRIEGDRGVLVCLDATGTGDVTRRGLRWAYNEIGSSTSTVAVADGLVYAAGFDGRLHCLDAETGKVYWVQELGGPLASSPLVADGKIYLGTDRQQFWILAAGREPRALCTVRMRDKVSSTATAANGVLYVATWKHLYAVETPMESRVDAATSQSEPGRAAPTAGRHGPAPIPR